MNTASSRSHAIFTIIIESKDINQDNDIVQVSCLVRALIRNINGCGLFVSIFRILLIWRAVRKHQLPLIRPSSRKGGASTLA